MAQKFLTNIDLNQNQLVNAKFEVLATDPSSSNFEGRLIYNSTEDTIKVWSGTAWRTLLASTAQTGGAANGVISGGTYAAGLTITESNGQTTITPNLATSSIAGLLTAADFTKLADATSEATASKLVIRDASGNAKIATPTLAAHIATKGYVDSARQGLDVKQSVRVASTANVAISTGLEAGDIIDGVTLVAGDRVLLKNQTTTSENGIYVAVASGVASRSSDANGTADTGELKSGTFAFVEEGTVNFDSGFVVSTDGTITVGSTNTNMSLTFVGNAERELTNYELIEFKLSGGSYNNILLASATAPGGNLGCQMGPAIQTYNVHPPYTLIANTVYKFRIDFTTNDPLYHLNAFYEAQLSFS